MQCYKFRFDLKNFSLDSILGYLNANAIRLAYVQEMMLTDNPHLQGYLETSVKSATIRTHIRKLRLGNAKGNGTYSLKTCDEFPIEYLSYLMKENQPQFIGFSEEDVLKVRMHQQSVLADMKQRKDNKKSIIEKLQESFLHEHKYDPMSDAPPKKEHFIMHVMNYHLDNNMVLREFNIISYAQTLMCRLSRIYYSQFLRKIMEKI